MKNFLKLSLITLLIITGLKSFAQGKKAEIKIKTSAECEMCQQRIEKAITFEKGVKSAKMDLDLKELTIVYNPSKTDPAKLREAVAKLGYDADTIKASEKAYNELPACCKKGGMESMDNK